MDGRGLPADEGVRQVGARVPALAADGRARGPLVTFLFADIRGYTRYTGTYGAESAARLADAFVSVVAGAVSEHGGVVRGSWGDQVLVEFASPRAAVRSAIELQARCVARTLEEPSLPLAVGVGIDVGEPAAEGVNQSAAALNLAARLCAKAGPGEVLATAELVHLAGAIDGASYVDRGSVHFKGVSGATRVVEVRGDPFDRDQSRRFRAALLVDHGTERHRALVWGAGLLALVLVVGLTAVVVLRRGGSGAVAVPPGGLAVIDADSGQLVDAVTLGDSPEGMARGGGDLWVAQAGADSLARVDLGDGRLVQTVPVGNAPVAVAATERDMWVVNSGDDTVSRVSTGNNRVLQTIGVGNQPLAVAAGFGSVWVVNSNDGTVTRIDAGSGDVTGTADVGRGPAGVAVGAGSVWVTNGRDGTVSPVDPESLEAGAPIPAGAGPKGIAVARSGVWVANRLDLTVTHIDPATRQVVATIAVGDSPFAVAASSETVWVSASAAGTVVRIDPGRNEVTKTTNLGASPYGLSRVEGRVWAASRPFASPRHIGGTLTVAAGEFDVPFSMDPAVSWNFPETVLVHDGLVGFRRAAGADNFDPVPNLAETLPAPTEGGRTYTFTLRPGIRYSTGRLVVPEDFRRGLERMFAVSAAAAKANESAGDPTYYDKIVGAADCLGVASACDLSEGITVGADTVTFRLVEPDPDFLLKLALPFASPVPPGTDASSPAAEAVAGTGPYLVAAYTPRKALRLERNPHFRSWSAAARPPAYPDVLRWRRVPDARLVDEVIRGRADVTEADPAQVRANEAAALRHPQQVHRDRQAFTQWLVMDTSRPPFDQVAARRAVALALDRGRLSEALGYGREQVACGLLPPGFVGYEPYCPLTANPGPSGGWHAPDLPLARRLIGRSGTRGARVDVYWPTGNRAYASVGRSVTQTLRRLGYDARLHSLDGLPNGSEPTRMKVTVYGWGADFPSASNFYQSFMSCPSRRHGSNFSRYCNRDLDALAAKAGSAARTDPGEADRLWREVYRTINDQAVIVPYTHGSSTVFVSDRVGNYQYGSYLGPLYDQMWVH